jgi:hypothetical protein
MKKYISGSKMNIGKHFGLLILKDCMENKRGKL